MNGAKPWQIAVVIIGLLGGTGLLAWNLFGGEKMNKVDEIVLIDVTNGDRFIADVRGRRSVLLPEKNPVTQEYTLLPIAKDESGQWRVRRLEELSHLPREKLAAVTDPSTGLVTPSDTTPRPLRN